MAEFGVPFVRRSDIRTARRVDAGRAEMPRPFLPAPDPMGSGYDDSGVVLIHPSHVEELIEWLVRLRAEIAGSIYPGPEESDA